MLSLLKQILGVSSSPKKKKKTERSMTQYSLVDNAWQHNGTINTLLKEKKPIENKASSLQ